MNKSVVFQSKSLISYKFTYKYCSMHRQISTIILPNKINQNFLMSCNAQTVFNLYQLYEKKCFNDCLLQNPNKVLMLH